MTISVRLDEETEIVLEKAAKMLGMTKSSIVKLSLKEFCSSVLEQEAKRPYDLIEDLLDREGSGKGDLSVRGEEILREAFRRKG
jgi:hypothetical protein